MKLDPAEIRREAGDVCDPRAPVRSVAALRRLIEEVCKAIEVDKMLRCPDCGSTKLGHRGGVAVGYKRCSDCGKLVN